MNRRSRSPWSPRNNTPYSSLNRMGDDPRINEVWIENDECFQNARGDYVPGLWAQLAPGYYNDAGGTLLHEGSVAALLSVWRSGIFTVQR